MMSDGDMEDAAATPRRPHPGDEWLTRSARPKRGAAPWERTTDTPPSAQERGSGDESAPITVADLIAKIHGEAPASEPTRHRAEPELDYETEPGRYGQPEPGRYGQPEPGRYGQPELGLYGQPELGLGDEPEPYPAGDDLDTMVLPALDPSRADLPDLTATRPPAHTLPKPRLRPSGRVAVVGRVAAALVAVLALVLTGGAWQWQSAKNNLLNRVSALDPDSRDIVDPNAQFGDENFLIVGTDSRLGENAGIGAGTTEDAAGARSDTVMLVNIPANRKRVVAVSFPRDLEIEPMKCEPWNPETREYGPISDPESPMYGMDEAYTEYKLNSAFAVGGPKCLVKVIQKLSGLHVNRFMAVDFVGFSKMVDALGGVEVCSTTPIEDYELGTVLATAGRQIVDGHTALNYVRARQVTTETNGDYGRIKRQQLFLSSLLRSLISKETFFSLSKLNNVVNMFIGDSYVDNVDTKDLVDLGQSVQGVTAGRITFVTVPTV